MKKYICIPSNKGERIWPFAQTFDVNEEWSSEVMGQAFGAAMLAVIDTLRKNGYSFADPDWSIECVRFD